MFCLSYCQNMGHKCPLGPPGSEDRGLTRQVITAPGYKIGSMSGLCPHFEFVCLVVHSQLKPSKCPFTEPSQQSPPRKLPISMSYVVSLILHFYAGHSCEKPHCCIDGVSQSLGKVRVFKEGHKIWQNPHGRFDTYYIMSNRR